MMKITSCFALLVALGVQIPIASAGRHPMQGGHGRTEAAAEVPAEISVADLEDVVGGLANRWKCALFFAGIAAMGITGVAVTLATGGAGGVVLGGVLLTKASQLGALACLV